MTKDRARKIITPNMRWMMWQAAIDAHPATRCSILWAARESRWSPRRPIHETKRKARRGKR